MMKTLFILYCFFACGMAHGQGFTSFNATDRWAENVPEKYAVSTDSLAKYITANFNTAIEKFRAIHIWTGTHIRYSTDSMYVINAGPDATAKITVAMQRRKGVCENYAAIFNDIANKCGLTSFVVNGYTKQAGRIDRSGHSWCAVSLSGTWLLCDPTWDKDINMEKHYFMVSPEEFITTHMPFDPLWQLMDNPITHAEFIKGYKSTVKYPVDYDYKDSIAAYLRMDEVQQLKASTWRIQKAGVVNDLIKTDVAVLKMNAEMIHEDRDAEKYNSAAGDINKATALLNNFIAYRNARFTPQKKEEDINRMLINARKILTSTAKTLKELENSEAKLQLNTEVLAEKIKKLSAKLSVQEKFLAKYFEKSQQERLALFYE